MTPAHLLYGAALRDRGRLVARTTDGEAWPLALDRWLAPVAGADARVLERAVGPVLDVGCGPGRHVRALVERGATALGVDVSAVAVAIARAGGAPVHHGDVFGPVPRPGTWRTALLLDGNLGIGGRPVALLARVAALLAPGGILLCETDAPGIGCATSPIRLDDGRRLSAPIPWARVGAEALGSLAAAAGLRAVDRWQDEGRWFAELAA